MKEQIFERVKRMPGVRRLAEALGVVVPLWTAREGAARRYYGQCAQDQWVVEHVFGGGKLDGYFLEMGAADGVLISNTYVLEGDFGWNGILVEPTAAFEKLVMNRETHCENICIAAKPGPVFIASLPGPKYMDQDSGNTLRSVMIEAEDEEKARILAVESFTPDIRRKIGEAELKLERIQAMSLVELLEKHDAPVVIDYFSLDVEGYEYAILKDFPFDRYRFRCMTIEHPSGPLQALLKKEGYLAVGRDGVGDVFYIHRSMKASYRRF